MKIILDDAVFIYVIKLDYLNCGLQNVRKNRDIKINHKEI